MFMPLNRPHEPRRWQRGQGRQGLIGWFSPRVFLGRRQRRLASRGVPVFAYHKIASPPPPPPTPSLYVSPPRFESQLAALKHAGWTPASLADTLAASDNAARKAVLTFDDGMANVLEHASNPSPGTSSAPSSSSSQPSSAASMNGTSPKVMSRKKLMDEAQVRDWLARDMKSARIQ